MDKSKLEMNLNKVALVRSHRGYGMLNVDRYLYNYKEKKNGLYLWICNRHTQKDLKCISRVYTITNGSDDKHIIHKVYGHHNHDRCPQEEVSKAIQRKIIADLDGKKCLMPNKQEKKEIQKDMWHEVFPLSSVDPLSKTIKDEEPTTPPKPPLTRKRRAKPTSSVVIHEEQPVLEEILPEEVPTVSNPTIVYLPSITDANNEEILMEVSISDETDGMQYTVEELITPHKIKKKNNIKEEEILSPIQGDNMDIRKLQILRTSLGNESLCVDGYIYTIATETPQRKSWICCYFGRQPFNCRSKVYTMVSKTGVFQIINIRYQHSHPPFDKDLKNRLFYTIKHFNPEENENLQLKDIMAKPIKHLCEQYSEFLGDSVSIEKIRSSTKNKPQTEIARKFPTRMRLFASSNGPPSIAVRMALRSLNIPYEIIQINKFTSEYTMEEFTKTNPQKQTPVLDDNGFFLPESVAIMQYLCDEYGPYCKLYSKDNRERGIINHRLCFNMSFYYSSIYSHALVPIYFGIQRSDTSFKKVTSALDAFETYLDRCKTKYAAANDVTIADFALISSTLCLEAIDFEFGNWPMISKWYERFKNDYPTLWDIASHGMQEIINIEQNPERYLDTVEPSQLINVVE